MHMMFRLLVLFLLPALFLVGCTTDPHVTREEQDERWSKALRAYTFQLQMPAINPTKEYVLVGSFETADGAAKPGGVRLYDRLLIEPPTEKKATESGVKKAGGGRKGGR